MSLWWPEVGPVLPTQFFSGALAGVSGETIAETVQNGTVAIVTDVDFLYGNVSPDPLATISINSDYPFFVFAPASGTEHSEHWSGLVVLYFGDALKVTSSDTDIGCQVSGWIINAP